MPLALAGLTRLRTVSALATSVVIAIPLGLALAGPARLGSSALSHQGTFRLGVYDPRGAFAGARNIGIEHIFMPWEEIDWPTLRAAGVYAASRGRELLITVEPWSWSGENRLSKEEGAAAIANGQFDPEIDAFCHAANALTTPVTIRWGHEMDDMTGRYTWSGLKPEDYVAAYRHFVRQCRTSAPSATFMWSPKGEENLAAYYPGDEYVDSVGISVFGLERYDLNELGRRRTFTEALGAAYGLVSGFGKPVVAAEVGFKGDNYVDTWAAEVVCAHRQFPLLEAMVYFNEVEPHAWPRGYGKPDWRIPASSLERDCNENVALLPPPPAVLPIIRSNLSTAPQTEVVLRPSIEQTPVAERVPAAASAPASEQVVASADPVVAADEGTPLLAWELASLFGGKFWMWEDGGGYLARNRQFIAWAGSGDTASYAFGRWEVTNTGRLCLKAVWHAKTGSAPSSTCFGHRRIGSKIIQKKEAGGEWYAFPSADLGTVDDGSKPRRGGGGSVSARLKVAQRNLTSSP